MWSSEAWVAGVVAAVVAAGLAVSLVLRDGDARPQPVSVPDAKGVRGRPDQSPPRELIAAGRVAVSAYYTTRLVKRPDGNAVGTYEWTLLDTTAGRYEKTDWAWVDVAPGMRTAAVLERDLPADRIGLLNLATGRVQRWIKVGRGVGGVQFSPDGARLLATAYRLDPDGLFKDASYRLNGRSVPGPKQSRTGFYVIDVASGKAGFTERPTKGTGQGMPVGGRQDFSWSRDGKLVWAPGDGGAGTSSPGGAIPRAAARVRGSSVTSCSWSAWTAGPLRSPASGRRSSTMRAVGTRY